MKYKRKFDGFNVLRLYTFIRLLIEFFLGQYFIVNMDILHNPWFRIMSVFWIAFKLIQCIEYIPTMMIWELVEVEEK